MTAVKRVSSFFAGLFMVYTAILFTLAPYDALSLVMFFMSLALLFTGIRMFFYYFTLARHKTGGLAVLYRAAVIFDAGLFAIDLPYFPLVYVMIYLAAIHAVAGIAAILKALEAKRLEAPSWKLNLVHGIGSTSIALLCLFYSKSVRIAVYIYSAGLFYSGIIRIIQAFRKTQNIYVQ